MKIAVISDSHDHLIPLRAALERAAEAGAEALIHCGDLSAPFVIAALKRFHGPVHVVFGNNDGDIFLQSNLARGSNVTLHGTVMELEIGGRKLLATHEPPTAEAFAATGQYDAVFYGHVHQAAEKRVGETLVLGAGELMGFKETPSFAMYDTDTNAAERISLGDVWKGYV
ncbi:MAG TPA: metallophosphoesterase family protein [Armatimonadota bacterium]|nr:metallophosphoesterase family protein [Armatimonadota bacterium]